MSFELFSTSKLSHEFSTLQSKRLGKDPSEHANYLAFLE